jgi:hypothetical protein
MNGKMRLAAGFAIGVGLALLASSASARMESCSVGQKVMLPGGKLGTVIEVNGPGCKVRQDGTNWEGVWSAFMLDPAPGGDDMAPVPTERAIGPGMYQCHGGSAGNMKLQFLENGKYANEQGTSGEFQAISSDEISFVTGPWEGFFGRILGLDKIGLTSRTAQSTYYMTCDLE